MKPAMDNLGRATEATEEYRERIDRDRFHDYLFGAMTPHLTEEQMEQAINIAHACMGRKHDPRRSS